MQVIGLYKEAKELQVACLRIEKGQIAIEFLDKREELLPFEKETLMVTGIDGKDLLIRHLNSPLRKKRALYKTLPFQLEALIPYSLDEVVVKPVYIPKRDETQGTFFTVSKNNLEKHLQFYRDIGVDSQWVSVVPMALLRFGQFICSEEETFVIFHIGEAHTQMVSMKDGMVHSHWTFHIGAKHFEKASIEEDCYEWGDANEKDTPKLFELLMRFKREVDRAFCFLNHKEQEDRIRKVLFCGQMTTQVEAFLKESESFRFSSIEIGGHRGFDAETIRPYAISIGLCLDALKNDQKSVQLRQGEYISDLQLKKIKSRGVKGSLIAGALFGLTLIFSHFFFQMKEQKLVTELDSFISHYQDDMPALKKGKNFTSAEAKVNWLQKQLRIPKSSEGYFSNPPRVSDFLAFIANHPKLEGIELLRIDYTLKSYPTLDAPKTGYVPKVHIRFASEHAQKAREFHDAIVEDREFVNSKSEIEWSRKGNEYEIAFFLQV